MKLLLFLIPVLLSAQSKTIGDATKKPPVKVYVPPAPVTPLTPGETQELINMLRVMDALRAQADKEQKAISARYNQLKETHNAQKCELKQQVYTWECK